MSGFLLVARHACSQALRGRRGVALVLLALLPVALALLNVRFSDRTTLTHFLGTVLMGTFQFVVPFGALFLGVAVLGDEIEGRTITYLFTRPLPRPVYFAGRLFGFAGAFAIILTAALLAVCLIFRRRLDLSGREIAGTLAIALAGFVVYTVFFAMLRALTRRAIFAGFLLAFIIEGWISKMPHSGLSRCSVWHHLALLQTRLFSTRLSFHDGLKGIAPTETVSSSITVLASVFLVAVAVGCWHVQTREVNVPAAVA